MKIITIIKYSFALGLLAACLSTKAASNDDEPVNLGTCLYLDELKQGFHNTDYQQCMKKMKQCPLDGIFPKASCVDELVAKTPACQQIVEIAKVLETSPYLLTIRQQASFTVFDVNFPADGGHLYSILSPDGCLIDTQVDPRDLSADIKQQYAKNDFFLVGSKPIYKKLADGTQRFTVSMQVKNACSACEIIATATLVFDYAKDGQWKKTELLSFKKQ